MLSAIVGGWYTDPGELHRQYHDSERLRVRMETHSRYGQQSRPFCEWVLDQLDPRPGDLVADVGCGPGNQYHEPLRARGTRVIGLDLSIGMAREAAAGCWPVCADAQALPLVDGSCDRVMCNHALYHVPDQVRALLEMRRIARSGGRVVVAANSHSSMRRLEEVSRQAAADVGQPLPRDRRSPFVIEDGDRVREVFPQAALREFRNLLVFPSPEPVVRYVATMGGIDAAFLEAIGRRVSDIIQAEGAFRVETIAGCLVAEVG